MACLEFYLDESGHFTQHPFVVVAGFMGLAEAWVGFRDAWDGILRREGVKSPFHMTDFEAKKDQFAGPEWTEPKRRRLLAALMKEITDRPLAMIGAAISVKHFKAVDWSINPRYEPIPDPYLLAVQDVLWRAIAASTDPDLPECNGDRIYTVLARQREADKEKGKDPKGPVDAYYRALALISGEGRLARTATIGDQIDYPQLQAADIAAFEFRWRLTCPDIPMRWPWRQIVKTKRVSIGGRGIDINALIPLDDSEEYNVTVSVARRPVDMILKGKTSKSKTNQGRRSKGGRR